MLPSATRDARAARSHPRGRLRGVGHDVYTLGARPEALLTLPAFAAALVASPTKPRIIRVTTEGVGDGINRASGGGRRTLLCPRSRRMRRIE